MGLALVIVNQQSQPEQGGGARNTRTNEIHFLDNPIHMNTAEQTRQNSYPHDNGIILLSSKQLAAQPFAARGKDHEAIRQEEKGLSPLDPRGGRTDEVDGYTFEI